MIKKNFVLLAVLSLLIGALLTLGFARFGTNTRFSKTDDCTAFLGVSVDACQTTHLGYPYAFLHSESLLSAKSGASKPYMAKDLVIETFPWLQLKPAIGDWAIWSAVAAIALAGSAYLVDRSTVSTSRKKRR